MTTIEKICQWDSKLLLRGWAGTPAARLEEIILSFGLRIRSEDTGFREGRLDLQRGLILLNSRLAEMCEPGTDLACVRNSILAQQLGHWRLHRSLLELGQRLQPVHLAQARSYAEEFLLPRDQLRREHRLWEVVRWRERLEWRQSTDLWRVCEELGLHFRVTPSAVATRLSRLGLLSLFRGRLALAGGGSVLREQADLDGLYQAL